MATLCGVFVWVVPLRTALADDFWVTAARALQFAGWSSTTGDIGVTQHLFGDGWSLQTTRVLNDLHLYGGVVGLDVDAVTGSAFLNTELSIRKWLIPTARVRVATESATRGGEVVPVTYSFFINTGIQDVRITGEGSLEAQIDINALGFYDIDAFISNRGKFEIDGFVYNDQGTLDYDLGPVSLSGNVFADILAAVTAPLFAESGTSNPFAVISGRAKLQNRIQQRDELIAKLEAGQTLTDEEMSEILSTSVLESVFGGAGSDLLDVMNEYLASESGSQDSTYLLLVPGFVPEPASCAGWFLLLGLACAGRFRRA